MNMFIIVLKQDLSYWEHACWETQHDTNSSPCSKEVYYEAIFDGWAFIFFLTLHSCSLFGGFKDWGCIKSLKFPSKWKLLVLAVEGNSAHILQEWLQIGQCVIFHFLMTRNHLFQFTLLPTSGHIAHPPLLVCAFYLPLKEELFYVGSHKLCIYLAKRKGTWLNYECAVGVGPWSGHSVLTWSMWASFGTCTLEGPSWQDEVGEKGTFSQRFVSLWMYGVTWRATLSAYACAHLDSGVHNTA